MKKKYILVFNAVLLLVAALGITYTSCKPDKCSAVCNNGGACNDNKCACPTAFYGDHCDSLSFTGTWKGADQIAGDTTYEQTITITQGTNDSAVAVTFGVGPGAHTTVSGVMNYNKNIISIKKQMVPTSWGADSVQAVIQLQASNKILHNYNWYSSHDGVWFVVQGQYTKQ